MDTTSLLELERSHDDALAGGVCSALSARFGVDVLLVRGVTVLLALSAGLGLVAYAWAWLVLPPDGGGRSLLEQGVPEAGGWSAGTKLVIGLALALVFVPALGPVTPWSVGPAIVVGVAVLAARHLGTTQRSGLGASPRAEVGWPEPPGAQAGELEQALYRWHLRLAEVASQQQVALAPPPRRWAAARPARAGATCAPHARRASWWWGFAVLALAGLAFWGATALAVPRPRTAGLAAALSVVGLALVVSAITRLPRPRLAVPAGLGLAVALLVPPSQPGSINARTTTVSYASVAQLPDRAQQLNAATVTYDLRDLSPDDVGTLQVQGNASHVLFLLPHRARPVVDYQLTGADLLVRGCGTSLTRIDGLGAGRWPERADDTASLHLKLRMRGSQAEVRCG